MKQILRLMLLMLFAIGCLQIGFAQQPAPQVDKTPATHEAAAESAEGIVYFYRIKQFVGSGLEPSVYCDDKELARMDNGRYFGVKLSAGTHVCRMGDKQTGFELDVKPGQSYYAKVSLEAGVWKAHGRLTLIQPEQGAFEIKKVTLLGPDKVKDRSLVAIFEGSEKK